MVAGGGGRGYVGCFSAADVDADSARHPGDEAGEWARSPTLLLESLATQKGGADDDPARVAKRLGRHADRRRLDERQPRVLVAPVKRQGSQRPADEARGPHAVAGVAERVVDAIAREAADDGQVGRGDVDRPAPRVLDP